MGSSRMAMSMVVVLVLLQLLLANGNDPPQCNFDQTPLCPPKATGVGHIVLVHGAGQGQWYWFKVKPILEAAGYNVTTIQLGPSITMALNSIENVTFLNYSQPLFDLMECIDDKVLLVGHSAGGLTIAAAMELYPNKTYAGVFVAAYMPDTAHNMSYVLDEGAAYPQEWEDTCTMTSGNETWYYFGDSFLRNRLYQMCPPEVPQLCRILSIMCVFLGGKKILYHHHCAAVEDPTIKSCGYHCISGWILHGRMAAEQWPQIKDLNLGGACVHKFILFKAGIDDEYHICLYKDITLMYTQKRPGSFFNNELAQVQLTDDKYGSVDRFYIVTGDDLAVYTEFQYEMIDNFPVKEVKVTNRSGHEVMLSKPLELSAYILDIARQYPSYFETTNAAGDVTLAAEWVEMKEKLNSIRRGAWWA